MAKKWRHKKHRPLHYYSPLHYGCRKASAGLNTDLGLARSLVRHDGRLLDLAELSERSLQRLVGRVPVDPTHEELAVHLVMVLAADTGAQDTLAFHAHGLPDTSYHHSQALYYQVVARHPDYFGIRFLLVSPAARAHTPQVGTPRQTPKKTTPQAPPHVGPSTRQPSKMSRHEMPDGRPTPNNTPTHRHTNDHQPQPTRDHKRTHDGDDPVEPLSRSTYSSMSRFVSWSLLKACR